MSAYSTLRFRVDARNRCDSVQKTIFADGGKNEKESEREREVKTILLKIEKP